MKEYFDTHDTFNMKNGMHLVECEPGYAVFEVELTDKHMSSVGRLHAHAGVLYSLAESASAAAALGYGYNAYAVEGTITYTGLATSGLIRAVAKCRDTHETGTGTVRVRIFDNLENLIAKASFTVAYTGEAFSPEDQS